MPSRMNKYYKYSEQTKTRANRNSDLYRTIYDEVEYTNVEGISIIEKNEKIDIEKIRELIGTPIKQERSNKEQQLDVPLVVEEYEEKNYDIRDVLNKAKNEREENKNSSTQYDILKNINLDSGLNAPNSLSDDDLKKMIEEITNNSRNSDCDLLDDLKTSHHLKSIKEEDIETREIDKSFFTSSLGLTKSDFEDLNEIKKDIKRNSILTKILLVSLIIIIIVGLIIFVF